MAFGNFKDLTRRTAADKKLRDKAFNITKNPKNNRYQCGLASMVYKFFDKKTSNINKGTGINSDVVSEYTHPLDLATRKLEEELHKPMIRKFEKQKVHSSFIDNIYGAVLSDMQLLSQFSKGCRFLLCVIDIYSKYKWVLPLKDKKGIKVTMAF